LYGRGFVLGAYRRGLADWITGETRIELAEDLTNLSGAISLAAIQFGQVDVALSASSGDAGDGGLASVAWSRHGDNISFAAQIDSASEEYRRLGSDRELSETEARATLGLELDELGSISLTGALSDRRDEGRISTFSLAYSPAQRPLVLSALYVDDGEPFWTFGISLTHSFGERRTAAVSASVDDGAFSATARAQSSTPTAGGLGWRVAVSQGAIERIDAGVHLRTDHYDARLEASRAIGADGLRGQFSTVVVWMDDRVTIARDVGESFAIVDVGAPGVGVYRDRQYVGDTNAQGRLLVSSLRPYETNRVSIDVDDVPLETLPADDEIPVRTPLRSGALIRFPTSAGAAGELTIVDEDGEPLPAGTLLLRDTDLMRFPVGYAGRIYIYGITGSTTLTAQSDQACQVVIDTTALSRGEPLRCLSEGQS
jgi:outer membrane usher protein